MVAFLLQRYILTCRERCRVMRLSSILKKLWRKVNIEVCVEGELKQFHKDRYMLVKGFYNRGEGNDLEMEMIWKGERSNYPSTSNLIDQFSQSICGRLMVLLEREGKSFALFIIFGVKLNLTYF